MRLTTAGESHGPRMTAIVENVPAGLPVDVRSAEELLRLRRGGEERSERQKTEKDEIRFTGGIRAGVTTGSPVCIEIENGDFRPAFAEGREERKITALRPGHADLPGMIKYGFSSAEDVAERASARSTVAVVAAGAVAREFLSRLGVVVGGYVDCLGSVRDGEARSFGEILKSKEKPLYMLADGGTDEIRKAKREGETLGGTVKIVVRGMKCGFGGYGSFGRRIDGKIAGALVGLPCVKGIEFGDGFSLCSRMGTETVDGIRYDAANGGYYRETNRAGGIEGGMTNGEDIVVRLAVKPVPTTARGVKTVDCVTKEETVSAKIRSDISAVPALLVVAECALSLLLTEEISLRLGGDTMAEIEERWKKLP